MMRPRRGLHQPPQSRFAKRATWKMAVIRREACMDRAPVQVSGGTGWLKCGPMRDSMLY